jgi:hypothetical protein
MEMKNDDNDTSIILNVDANMDDLKYYAGTSNILKYRNPPIYASSSPFIPWMEIKEKAVITMDGNPIMAKEKYFFKKFPFIWPPKTSESSKFYNL